jgi:CrcB protein
MSVGTWAGAALLGGLGAIGRLIIDRQIGSSIDTDFPLGTFAINVSGALLLGLLTGIALTGDALVLAGTATLGSYTTFSTWMFETQRLQEDGEFAVAVANIVLSVAVGLAAIALGRAIGAQL